ncbi:MAG: hypothetical protein JNM49_10935 [Flavobacteriales bacterium]|nr:hypothetical protein [Flavobacteriales bacterium]
MKTVRAEEMTDRSFIHAEGGIDMQQHVAGDRVHPTEPHTRVRGQVMRDGARAMTRQRPGHHRLNLIHAVILGLRIGLKSQHSKREDQETERGHGCVIEPKAAPATGSAR